MGKSKITVVGAGNVGAAVAQMLLVRNLADVVLIDIVKGLAEGKALDLVQAGPILSYDCKIIGTQNWAETADSNIVIITSGLPRKPGMSRDDLLAKNTQIVKSVTEQIKKYSQDCFIIVVCNPLDAMVYTAAKTSGFEKNKIMGMAGALDCARFNYFIADRLGVSVNDVHSILMGGHGDDMVPLPRFTTVKSMPLTCLMAQEEIGAIVERTRNSGIEIVNLLGHSAYYAPAAGAVKMAEAILKDKKSIISCCAYCDKEYNVRGYFVGVPAVLGSAGVEKVINLDLNEQEQSLFNTSLAHVKQLVEKVDNLF